jgi:hypothetical protein
LLAVGQVGQCWMASAGWPVVPANQVVPGVSHYTQNELKTQSLI